MRNADTAEILARLGRIEDGINKVGERVRMLEIWQGWLKGAWSVLMVAWAYLCRMAGGVK
jgi:hypothetical protein